MAKKIIENSVGRQAFINNDKKTAVRWTLQILEDKAPGSTVEVRVPPYGAIQCISDGSNHRRGTPPNVVEMSPEVWLGVATGKMDYNIEVSNGNIMTSGAHAGEVERLLPLVVL
ncbi:MAG: sterol carrier family protein [Candidatus Ancillula sp.]|jgi:hypothetical protein|nr:sterol carrier family protein [Candidatus Ancillula sp.]